MQTLCYLYHSKDKEQANNETLYYFYLHCKCVIFLICKYNFTIFIFQIVLLMFHAD